MLDPVEIDEFYKKNMIDLSKAAPDGVIHVNLEFLHQAGLLNLVTDQAEPESVTQYFHVVETPEKVTLYNDRFVVWIAPQVEKELPITHTLIALIHQNKLQLEIVFRTSGIYNTPRHVLQILQHFLLDMIETEETILAMEKSQ